MKKERLIRHGSLALDTETGQVYRAVPLVQTYSPLERYQMSKIEEKLQAQKREQARKQAREERLRRQRHIRNVRRKQRVARILGIFAITLMAAIVTAYCKWSDESSARSVATVQQRQDYPRSYDLEGSLARAGATDYKVSFDDEGYGTTVYWRLGSYQYALLPTYDTLMVYRDAYIPGALGWLAPLFPAEKISEWHPTVELRASAFENGYSVDDGDWYVGNDVIISSAMLSEIQRQVKYYC